MEKVRELFLAAVEDGKLRSYVLLNFKASKLDRPVMSWSDSEWGALVVKFEWFRDMLSQAAQNTGFRRDEALRVALNADSTLWGELEDKLAAKILQEYKEAKQ